MGEGRAPETQPGLLEPSHACKVLQPMREEGSQDFLAPQFLALPKAQLIV